MVSAPLRLLRGLATGVGTAALLAAFVLVSAVWFRVGPAVRLTSTGMPLLDSQSAYTPDQAYAQLAAYGELGRSQYQLFLVGDFAWALFFGITVSVLLLLALRIVGRDTPPWNWVLFLPAAVVLLDWFENASLLAATSRFPRRMDGLVGLIPYATTAKLTLVNVTFLLALAAVATLLFGLMGRARRQTA